MEYSKRIGTSLGIALLGVLVVLFFVPRLVYKPHGILLPATKSTRAPIAADQVVQLRNRPYQGEILGHINIERKYPAPGNEGLEQMWAFAQKEAARVGANAILINQIRVGGVTKSHLIYLFQATAYFLPTS